MNTKSIIITIVLVVVFAAAGFFAGMKYQQSQRFRGGVVTMGSGGMGGRFGEGRFGGQNNNMQAVRGEIVSSDNNSITIKLSDGSSKIVVLPSNATIYKTDKGSTSDLTNGTNVMIFGTTNSDGSVTAQMVQLNPMNRPMMVGATNAPTATPSSASQY